jgi:hypothetical protein
VSVWALRRNTECPDSAPLTWTRPFHTCPVWPSRALPTPTADSAMSIDPLNAPATSSSVKADPDSDASSSSATALPPHHGDLIEAKQPKPEPVEDLATFTAASASTAPSMEDDGASDRATKVEPIAPAADNADDRMQTDGHTDLPPPFPFASTSKAVLEIDQDHQERSASSPPRSVKSRSTSAGIVDHKNGNGNGNGNGSVKSGSSTPMVGGTSGEEEEGDVKPSTGGGGARATGKGKKKKVEEQSEPQFIGDLPLAEDEVSTFYPFLSSLSRILVWDRDVWLLHRRGVTDSKGIHRFSSTGRTDL